jgi:DNA-binding PadR family transcriptional regulator
MRSDWWSHGTQGSPFPWFKWGRFFGPGELRLSLLSLLEDGPKHGYQLMKELEERSGGVYRASAGSIYPTLQQLEDEGLAISEQQDGKRVYRLTEAGSQELEREKLTVRKIWQRAEHWSEWAPWVPEAAIIAKPIAKLFRTARRALADGEDTERIVKVREIIDRACREIEALGTEPSEG